MAHRPITLLLLAFAGGILLSAELLSAAPPWISLIAFVSAVSCVSACLFLRRPVRIICLSILFFATGILLEQARHSPSVLAPMAMENKKVTLEGTLLEPMRVREETGRLAVRVHRIFRSHQPLPVDEKISVTIYSHVPAVNPGERIRFPAKLRLFRNFNNPGRYDYVSAMKQRGFSCAASVSDGRYICVMGPGPMPVYRKLLEAVQRPIREFFTQNLDPENNALFHAMILGDRRYVTEQMREPFDRTGLGHVLAVSGLHIGLVAWSAFFLLKWLLSRPYSLPLRTDIRKIAALLTCLPVVGYTIVSGFQVPGQRAMVMALVFLLSLIVDREKEVWSTLSLAALIILALDPHALLSTSFQMSFVAVIGILWLTPAFLKKIPYFNADSPKTAFTRIVAYFLGLAAVCLTATLFLTPLILNFFHRVSLVSVPANIMIVPILGLWVIPLGLISAAILPLSSGAAVVFLKLGAWGLDLMMGITRFWADLPWSSIWMVTPNLYEILLCYALIFCLFFFRGRTWAKTGTCVVAALLLIDAVYWMDRVNFNQELRVSFIDVGQANAALVEFPGGEKMMIDGGGFPRDQFNVGKMVVAPFLWNRKIRKIDYLVLSHPQSDHMNGLRFIAEAFHPKEFWFNGDRVTTASFVELMGILKKQGIEMRLPEDLSNCRQINTARVEVLHPPHRANSAFNHFPPGKRLNNNSLVLKITHGDTSFLFPGDLERAGERSVASNAGDRLKSDILLSPHHGSRNSSTWPFLEKVRPRICVISAGQGNFFGFPHNQTLERLKHIGCKVIRIDQTGAVEFHVNEDGFGYRTYLEQ